MQPLSLQKKTKKSKRTGFFGEALLTPSSIAAIVGVDVGANAGIAVLTPSGDVVGLYRPDFLANGIWDSPHTRAIADWLTSTITCAPAQTLAMLEHPITIPGQGLGAQARFRWLGGAFWGILTTLGYQTLMCYPIQWKRAMNLVGKVKRDSLAAAIATWPNMAGAIGNDHNLAEALIIAEWTRRLLLSGRFPKLEATLRKGNSK